MSGDKNEPPGFSEEALRGLHDLELRLPPPQPPDLEPDPGPVSSVRPHYWGHRERLRQRFLAGGHAAMPEYELLELLLFNAIERIDVKPLAKALLAVFGDLNGVVAASEHRLMQVPGTTPKVWLQIRVAEAFAHRMARARVIQRSVISSWDELMAYCRTVMAYRETEQFRILFLDRKNVLIADEAQAQGHRRSRAGLSPRGGAAGAGAQCVRADPRAQPPLGRSDPERRRHRDDPRDRGRLPRHRRRAARSRRDRQGRRGLVPQPRRCSDAQANFRFPSTPMSQTDKRSARLWNKHAQSREG